jgi:hypothetical protein
MGKIGGLKSTYFLRVKGHPLSVILALSIRVIWARLRNPLCSILDFDAKSIRTANRQTSTKKKQLKVDTHTVP